MKKLRDYQVRSVNLMLEKKRVMLCLDMGLGKTASCLETVRILKERGEVRKTLIIAPKYVARKTWPDEINDKEWDFSSLTYSVILGTPKQREKAVNENKDIYIINKENIVWLYENHKDFFKDLDFLIFDESSALKSAKAKTKTGRMTRYKAVTLISKTVKYISLLTGTPAPNGIEDLYGQVEVIKPGLLGKSKYQFYNTYFNNVSKSSMFPLYVLRKGSRETILDKIKDIMFQLKSEEVLKLPECLYTVKKIEPSKQVEEVMDCLDKEMYYNNEKDLEIVCVNSTSKYSKLKQLGAGGVYYEDNQGLEKYTHIFNNDKIEILKEMLNEATSGVLVFYSYKFEKENIEKEFGSDCFVSDKNIDRFKKREIPVLFAHPAQIGHGLNIQQAGNTIVWLSITDSLELYQQSNKRFHRSGQREDVVNVIHMLCGMVENDLYRLLNMKDATQEDIIKYMEKI